jgi:hypothetical protein
MAGFSNSQWVGVAENPIPSGSVTASGNGGAAGGYGAALSLRAQLNVTAASGTTPTLDVVIEDSVDGGVTWNTVGTFTQKTAVAREVINVTVPFADSLRVRWTVGGTTPNFTFAVHWVAQA